MAGRINPRDTGSVGLDPHTVLLGWVLAATVSIAGTGQLAIIIAAQLGVEQAIPTNPIATLVALSDGSVTWSPQASGAAIILWILLGAVVLSIRRLLPPRARTAVDQAVHHLASSRELAVMQRKAVQRDAPRLIRNDLATEHPGIRFGTTVTGRPLFSTWEDLFLVIFGPRSGKTSSVVIPAIVEAPGVVVTTSNKPDVITTTIDFRKTKGEVWVFDPQDIAMNMEERPWFFDPLDIVRRDPDKMDVAAAGLADIFLTASRPEDGKRDAFFEPMGRDLLAIFLLAAAIDDRPITDVHAWVNDVDDRTPIGIVESHEQWAYKVTALRGKYNVTEKTRSGVFSQAMQMVACLDVLSARKWVTASPSRRRFDPAEFVRSTADTIYLLSEDSKGASMAPLTTALVAAIMEEAERYAIACGGRLPVPLVAPLDEAANVVRWRELPVLYSHYGSRGIILLTILQTYSQGIHMWGKTAMETLWSAATIVLVGPSVRDDAFLRSVENLVGEAEVWEKSSSSGREYRTVSRQIRSKKILTVADLAAIPMGRALMLAAKHRPAIIATEAWWKRPWPAETTALLKGTP